MTHHEADTRAAELEHLMCWFQHLLSKEDQRVWVREIHRLQGIAER